MKLAIFCHNFEVNGANHFVYTLVNSLKTEFDIHVFSNKLGNMAHRFDGIDIQWSVISDAFDFELLKSYDAVLVNSLMMSRIVLECSARDVPHALVVHETWHPTNIDYYLNEIWNIDGLNVDDILNALKKSQHVVFPANYLSDIYKSIVPDVRSSTIYCTIDIEKIDDRLKIINKKSARLSLNISPEKIVFLQVGTVTVRKAQKSTLEAFLKLYSMPEYRDLIELIFVGARDFRPGEVDYINSIKQTVRENGADDVVKIIGVQDNIYDYFIAADILVHPSINEVLPLAILEAAYCKCPVIVSNLDGMPEVVVNGQEGLLINPYDIDSIADAMIILASNESVRIKMGEMARLKAVNQHAQSVFARKYMNLIDFIVPGSKLSKDQL